VSGPFLIFYARLPQAHKTQANLPRPYVEHPVAGFEDFFSNPVNSATPADIARCCCLRGRYDFVEDFGVEDHQICLSEKIVAGAGSTSDK
jgi:hypothetical protein